MAYTRDTSHDSVAPVKEMRHSSVAMLPNEMPETTADDVEFEVRVPPDGDRTPTPCTSRAVPLAPFQGLLSQNPGLDDNRFGVQPCAAASERLNEREEMHVPLGDAVTVKLRKSLLNTTLCSVATPDDNKKDTMHTQRPIICAVGLTNQVRFASHW